MTSLPNLPNISGTTSRPAPPSVDDLMIFSENGKNYLVGVDYETFISMNASDLRRHLIALGFSARANGAPLSEVDAAIHRVQTKKCVAYVGPLAGKNAGIHSVAGQKILVTGGPKIIAPDASVEWPLLRQILEQMFTPDDPVQLVYFWGWLAHAYNSLRNGVVSQGQALAIAGRRDSGKSLVQDIISTVLGGRVANPYAYMTGRTDFNRELFGAEVLMFGDEVASTDYRNRVKFGAFIKQFVVNATQRCHGKGREAVLLDPLWRVVMSLNDEATSLDVLPPMTQDSMTDKLTIFKVARPTVFDADWKTWARPQRWERIMREVPGLLGHLADFRLPHELHDGRLGVKAYQNPDLLVVVGAESPDRRLLELVDSAAPWWPTGSTVISPESPPPRAPWSGTAQQLESRLFKSESVSLQARRLLYYEGACGTYLSTLTKKNPGRVKRLPLLGGLNRYQITVPENNQ